MSRAGSSVQRPLSTTEELEKLEQSITLTLQEIDHNFSKAHRIVTTSILPLVEQYGEHSRAVWEASKFWKQFFEASANVSLSGYEELAGGDEDTTAADESTAALHDSTADLTPRPHSRDADDTATPSRGGAFAPDDSSALLSDGDGDLTGSTPRPPATKTLRPQVFAPLQSPYEALRAELKREQQQKQQQRARGGAGLPGGDSDSDDGGDGDSTGSQLLAERTARLPDLSMTPQPAREAAEAASAREEARRGKDPLLHRLLDKNYRIQATPHRGVSPVKWKVTEKPRDDGGGKGKSRDGDGAARPAWVDSSPLSSPEMEAPKLRSAAFMSPVRAAYRQNQGQGGAAAPRTPGVSVQTPAAGRKTRDVFARDAAAKPGTPAARRAGDPDEIDWDSDSDGGLYGGLSPPKTIQFALPPSKLLQTPAREASKRIVEDILLTAGAAPSESGEYSPTIVKMNSNILDDSF